MAGDLQPWDDEFLVVRGNYLTEISPALAAELLTRNHDNRNPKERAITQYSRDMLADNWDPDASDIKFSTTGELVDGQNRLMACIRAGVSFRTLVRTGVNSRAKHHVDTGVKRTAGDMLKMQGMPHPSVVGAAVALRTRYELRVTEFGGKRALDAKGAGPLTHDELLDYLAKHPSVKEFATEAMALHRILPAIPGSAILGFLSTAAEVENGDAAPIAHQFVNRLITGEFGGPGDPLQALMSYAARARALQQGSPGYRGRVGQESHMLAMIRVWNALRTNEKIEVRMTIKNNHKLIMPI